MTTPSQPAPLINCHCDDCGFDWQHKRSTDNALIHCPQCNSLAIVETTSDAAAIAGRWTVEAERRILRDGAHYLTVIPMQASHAERKNFVEALPALIELAALTAAGDTNRETLRRLAGLALDHIEGKGDA